MIALLTIYRGKRLFLVVLHARARSTMWCLEDNRFGDDARSLAEV